MKHRCCFIATLRKITRQTHTSMYYFSNIYSSLPSSTMAPNLQIQTVSPSPPPCLSICLSVCLSLPPSLPPLSLLLSNWRTQPHSQLSLLSLLPASLERCLSLDVVHHAMRWCGGHRRTLSSARHRVSQQPSPEKTNGRISSQEFFPPIRKRTWKKDRVPRPNYNTKLPRNMRAATWRLQCLMG